MAFLAVRPPQKETRTSPINYLTILVRPLVSNDAVADAHLLGLKNIGPVDKGSVADALFARLKK